MKKPLPETSSTPLKQLPKALLFLALAACSSTPSLKKTILDQSGSEPAWVGNSKTSWEESGRRVFRSSQQIRGNERLSGCYDLARINGRSLIVSEIQSQIRGVLDTHEASLSENAEILLSKSRSEEFGARATGIRFSEEYFLRFRIEDEERIDCHVLAEISNEDYRSLKRKILYQVEEADPRLKEQIKQKHIDFFKPESTVKAGV